MYPEVLAAICFISGGLGFAVGAALLMVPRRTLHERTGLWRWLFEVDLVALLDRRKTIERALYRHHCAFGVAVIVGAVALLAALWGLRNQPLVTSVLPAVLGALGAGAVMLTSWTLAVFALGIGMFLLVRPSALKGVEAAANRWIEPFPSAGDPAAFAGETIVTRLVLQAPRLSALVLMAAGIACLLALTIS